MDLRIATRSTAPLVVEVAGELDLETVPPVRSYLHPHVEAGRPVVLDLSGVRFLDCSTLGLLVELATAAGAAGGRVQVAALRPRQRRLVRFFGLDDLLGVVPTAAAAAAVPAAEEPA